MPTQRKHKISSTQVKNQCSKIQWKCPKRVTKNDEDDRQQRLPERNNGIHKFRTPRDTFPNSGLFPTVQLDIQVDELETFSDHSRLFSKRFQLFLDCICTWSQKGCELFLTDWKDCEHFSDQYRIDLQQVFRLLLSLKKFTFPNSIGQDWGSIVPTQADRHSNAEASPHFG